MKQRAPRTSMNKETWESLSAEGKTTWDKLNEADKQKVLQYVTKRNEKDSMEANQHEVTKANENDVVQTKDKDEDNGNKVILKEYTN
jgi:dihydrofolate reductase